MFYYCAKCGNIKKVTLKGNEGVSCEVCGTPMQPVPAEYLMPNGNFFKSQDARQNFISAIQSSDTYDPEIGGKKEEVKREIEEEKQQRIQEMNQKMEQEQFHLTCPVCGSHSVPGAVSSDLPSLRQSQRTEDFNRRQICKDRCIWNTWCR